MANGDQRPDEAATEQAEEEQDPREREPEMLAYRKAQERRAGRSG